MVLLLPLLVPGDCWYLTTSASPDGGCLLLMVEHTFGWGYGRGVGGRTAQPCAVYGMSGHAALTPDFCSHHQDFVAPDGLCHLLTPCIVC